MTEKDESGDRHVTEQSEERGRVVTLGLRLRDRTVRKQFYTTDTVQVTLTRESTCRLFNLIPRPHSHKICIFIEFSVYKWPRIGARYSDMISVN